MNLLNRIQQSEGAMKEIDNLFSAPMGTPYSTPTMLNVAYDMAHGQFYMRQKKVQSLAPTRKNPAINKLLIDYNRFKLLLFISKELKPCCKR